MVRRDANKFEAFKKLLGIGHNSSKQAFHERSSLTICFRSLHMFIAGVINLAFACTLVHQIKYSKSFASCKTFLKPIHTALPLYPVTCTANSVTHSANRSSAASKESHFAR